MLSKEKLKITKNDVRAKAWVGFEFTVRSSLDLQIEDLWSDLDDVHQLNADADADTDFDFEFEFELDSSLLLSQLRRGACYVGVYGGPTWRRLFFYF